MSKNSVQKLKSRLKQHIQYALPSRWPPILCASMGRSGSTLVFNAVRRGQAKARFHSDDRLPLQLVTSDAWRPSQVNFHQGVVYKTHAPAGEMPATFGGKVVFVFGLPSEAALSVLRCREVLGESWIKTHFFHLASLGTISDLTEWDVLGYERQIVSWRESNAGPRIMIRYESLWEKQPELEAFLGFPVSLPPKRIRSSIDAMDPVINAKVQRTFAELDAWVDTLPKCQVLN